MPTIKSTWSQNEALAYYVNNTNETLDSVIDILTEEVEMNEIKFNKIKPTNKLGDLFSYKKLSPYVGLRGRIPIRANTTYVGVEIEVEKVLSGITLAGTWRYDNDGSLKDNGAEFVTIPIKAKYLEIELRRLFSSIKKSEATCRCSTHVHLNVRDFTLEELKVFLAIYMVFEKSLYNFSGARWNNNYCVPLFNTSSEVLNFVSRLDRMSMKDFPTFMHKYSGLNTCPIYGGESKLFGTVEFRHMEGTKDTTYILNWINLIISLKIFAKKTRFIDLNVHLQTMNTTSGYYWLAKEVFGNWVHLITEQKSFKSDVESCITKAKTIFQKKKTIKKELKLNLSGKDIICVE